MINLETVPTDRLEFVDRVIPAWNTHSGLLDRENWSSELPDRR